MNAELAELAAAHGVATSYRDGQRRVVAIDDDVVVTVLAELGVDAATRTSVRRELARVRDRSEDELPPTIVLRQGEGRPIIGQGVVLREDGVSVPVHEAVPADLPLGWHRLVVGRREATLIVTPRRMPVPPRTWGWMVQLYAMRSTESWGMGDFSDLARLIQYAGVEQGAGLVLINPVHAPTPVIPVEPSPYAPSSRRFVNPLYLSVPDASGYESLDPSARLAVDAPRPAANDRIDYDAVWAAKRVALERVHAADRGAPDLAEDLAEDLADRPALREFAVFCALAERYGRRWRNWPADLRHPASPAVARASVELADRVDFHAWLQRVGQRQLAHVQRVARNAGMPIGVVHDLAVGVDPDGADAWALQDVLATGATIGAPADAFNQLGQDWRLSPWHPRRLAEAGYQPYRDVVAAALRHGGGVRVDHVAGLWRLWWVPPGEPPRRGTYVHYDAEAMLGVLALEAHRAGASVVIGEDLGTVEPEVTEGLRERGALGCAVLWFQQDDRPAAECSGAEEPGDGAAAPLLPPAHWPRRAVASVSTHDLPTAAGFLRGEHVETRAALGLLTGDVESERRQARADRDRLLGLLRDEGLLDAEPIEEEIILAMHRLLARTPCRLRVVSPYDALGEARQPNLPGTVDQYPNWRLPLPVSLEDFATDPRVRATAAVLRAATDAGGPDGE